LFPGVIAEPTLSSLGVNELGRRLNGDGIVIQIDPFVVHVRSPIPIVAQGLHALYGEQHLLPLSGTFADFHVAVLTEHRLTKRVCVFEMDGFRPFTPLAWGEAFAFFEWGLNWCVTTHCHNWITIHSAVLEKNGRAVILPAPPGSGKSTLCAALMLHGWRLLSDEMTLLDPKTGLVTPAPRAVSLKNESIELIRKRSGELKFGPVAHDTLKGNVAHMQVSPQSRALSHVPAMPAWVVFPKFERGSTLTVRDHPKARALVELTSNSFNHNVHGRAGFEALAQLVDQCACHDLEYSRLEDALAWFDALEATA
jgi:HprK-related kinase A